MKTNITLIIAVLPVFPGASGPFTPIEDLRLQVQGTNAVLSWASVEGETFIVRYRPRLDEAHPLDTNRHAYQFVFLDGVFLDGCETHGGDWDKAFGIMGPGLFTLDYYRERTKRPALFVGNKYSVPIGIAYEEDREIGGVIYSGEIPRSMSEFYNQFIFWWQTMGRPYDTAVDYARQAVQGAYPNPKVCYVDSPKKGETYWPGDDQGRVGYEEMRFNQFNKHYDIPRP